MRLSISLDLFWILCCSHELSGPLMSHQSAHMNESSISAHEYLTTITSLYMHGECDRLDLYYSWLYMFGREPGWRPYGHTYMTCLSVCMLASTCVQCVCGT